MTTKERFESAKKIYAQAGVDVEKAIETLKTVPVSCTAGREMM